MLGNTSGALNTRLSFFSDTSQKFLDLCDSSSGIQTLMEGYGLYALG